MFRWIIFLLTVASLTQDSSGKNLLDACTKDGECPSDSKCTIRGCDGSICLCRGNLIPNLNYTKCVSFAEIGESCTGSKFCRPVSSRCDHVKGECTCQNGYSASSSNNKVIYCKQKPLLSTSTSFSLLKEPCDDNRQKCSPENHLECDKGVCVCSNGYKEASIDIINAYPFNVVQCVPVNFSIAPIGERCHIESVCPDNAICETRSKCDGNLACYCKEGYVSNENNEKCLKIQYLRGKCVSNNQCLGPNAACIGGLCACTEGYLSSSNNTRCRREMSWFVSFPLLGDRCMGFLSSCYNYDEQECKNERCVCKEGYRPLLEVERKLRHKEFSQCVKNDTLPDAFKENIHCTDMTASDYSDPYYSEGKRSDMNNDSGSEISFERQSSGRYSFKIPRPFATYDTTPADNLSFHNRSFKEDETHRLREDELKSLNGTLAKFYFDDIDYKPHEEYRPHENGK
uniref:EB domain-containing protein n=1 Tax=Magallana gigas TaxID=29159 RepID=K1QZ31_MAGGI